MEKRDVIDKKTVLDELKRMKQQYCDIIRQNSGKNDTASKMIIYKMHHYIGFSNTLIEFINNIGKENSSVMSVNELEANLSITRISACDFKVTITYHGQKYSTISKNTDAYFRLYYTPVLNSEERYNGYTYIQALQAFYDECKTKNNLE